MFGWERVKESDFFLGGCAKNAVYKYPSNVSMCLFVCTVCIYDIR